MKKNFLFLTFILNVIIAFTTISGANGYSDFVFPPRKINNAEVQTLICSFSGHTPKKFYNNFHSESEEENRRIEETEPVRNLSLIFSKAGSVRIIENIKIQRTRIIEALPDENSENNLFIRLSEQSAVSKNKSRQSETRQNIQQRK